LRRVVNNKGYEFDQRPYSSAKVFEKQLAKKGRVRIMTSEQVQQVVNAENERLNKQAEEKALVRIRDIFTINKRIETLEAERAKLQAEINALQFDSVTVADVIGNTGGGTPAAG
jgi:hypothetical protein